MIAREKWTLAFWSAAYFIRRAPYRSHLIAIRTLDQVAAYSTGKVRERAVAILREINEQPTRIEK